jgi:hypothetical protein
MLLIKIVDFASAVVGCCLLVWACFDFRLAVLVVGLLTLVIGQAIVQFARRYYGYKGSMLVAFLDAATTWPPWPW